MVKIVDVKCPDSGEADTFDLANLGALDQKDEIKFVIRTRRDYEFARGFIAKHRLAGRVRQVLLSPVAPDPKGTWEGIGSAGAGGMDVGGWFAGEAGIAVAQVYLGSGDARGLRRRGERVRVRHA